MSTGAVASFARGYVPARNDGVKIDSHLPCLLVTLCALTAAPACGYARSQAPGPRVDAVPARASTGLDVLDAGARSDAQPLRAAAALARVPQIAETVASIRGLRLRHPVSVAVQGEEEFRRFLDGEVEKEMPRERAAQSVRALVRLGLLTAPIDLGKTVEDAMLSQAGAYYDPTSKRFYLVLIPEDDSMLDVMSAHELTHALADQYFDLAAYTNASEQGLTNDAQQARRLVGEGDATLVMLAYQAKVSEHEDLFDPTNRRIEQAMVASFAALDPARLARMAAENPATLEHMGAGMKGSLEAMQAIPPYILDPLFGAYTRGASAVAAVRDAGGWPAVGELYTNPPESTAELLHPVEKLIGRRSRPVELTFAAALPGLAVIDTDVVGELTMAVYFKNWRDPAPASEVTGWAGDRYAVYRREDETVGCWLTAWDTIADARRFQAAYTASLAVRFPGDALSTHRRGARGVRHADGTVTAVLRPSDVEREVRVVDGARMDEVDAYFDWMHRRLANSTDR